MDLTKDLITLEALSGSLESADLFAETYQKALEKASKQGDIEQIKQLKRVLMGQCLFVLSAYLREEATIKECEEKHGMQ
jgi:hypothetical protein